MKTALDIITDYHGCTVRTWGKSPVFTCQVILADGDAVTAYGTTLESAEDTAWCGVAITLRD